MRVAWFRARMLEPDDPFDDTAALIAEIRSAHEIQVFTEASAHDFVWKDFRAPYDLSVCELDDTPAHAFIWPYLLHYGGVLRLQTLVLHDDRAAAYLRAPLMASRATVVPHPSTALLLQLVHPGACVRSARTGVGKVRGCEVRGATVQGATVRGATVQGATVQGATVQGATARGIQGAPVRFGVLPADRLDLVRRALARACGAGAEVELVADSSPEQVLQHADVIVSLRWPWFGEPQTPALAAMAAGKPAVVLETAAAADWPTLDPQTWRPRGLPADAPIAVSIDPRDEEHSLVLALRRLSTDTALRAQLGRRAHEWWRAHATPRHAADDWERILVEAVSLRPPARPADWPGYLATDATARARAILDEFGVAVDFLSA